MEQGRMAFTAVYLKSNHGYVGFIEELPGVNAHGVREMLSGEEVVRESFGVPRPRAA